MSRTARHRAARLAVAVLLVLPALPSLDAAANPQHLDTARAFLAGSLWVADPTTRHDMGEVEGRFFAPFPPLPAALALAAVVTAWPDAAFNSMVVAAAVLAVAVAARLGDRWGGRATGTWCAAAVGLGSGLWTATAIHDTYHSAHVLAVLATLAALDLATARRRPGLAGFALGVAALARQAVALAAVPLALIAAGCRGRRPGQAFLVVLAAAAVPVGAYLAVNTARFGSPLDSGYSRARHHPRIAADVERHGAFSTAYVGRNLAIMTVGGPRLVPAPPYLVPDPRGMSLLLVSPWLVLACLPLLRPDRPGVRRTTAWCWLGAAAISVPHLLYVNTGWLQFGFRFALDWLPFLLLAAALGVRRLPPRWALPPLALAILVNAWGVASVLTFERWSHLVP